MRVMRQKALLRLPMNLLSGLQQVNYIMTKLNALVCEVYANFFGRSRQQQINDVRKTAACSKQQINSYFVWQQYVTYCC